MPAVGAAPSAPQPPAIVRPAALPDRALFWAFAVGWGLSLALAVRRLPPEEGAAGRTGWVERYRSVRPLVAGFDRAHFVHDFAADMARHRLHRAQLELAPCVLQTRPTVVGLPLRRLLREPLILDFHVADGLEQAIARLETLAARRGVELEVSRFPGSLAVVRVRAPS